MGIGKLFLDNIIKFFDMSVIGRIVRNSEKVVLSRIVSPKSNINSAIQLSGSKVFVPSPPKKPLTAYMIFCQENRKNILKENPSLNVTEQIKILANKWNQLDPEMKEPFLMIARESNIKYGQAHKEFYQNLTAEQQEEILRLKAEKKESRQQFKVKKALRESGVPKRTASGYSLFIQSQAKEANKITKASDFIKIVALTWGKMSDEEKKPFNDQAIADKEKFELELKEWKEKLIREGHYGLLSAFEARKGKKMSLEIVEVSDHTPKSDKAKKRPSKQ